MVIFQLIGCIMLADFITGLVHWWEDAYGLPTWPIIGKLVIEPNIQHHLDPTFMIRMGTVFGRNVQTLVIAGAFCIVGWMVGIVGWKFVTIAFLSGVGNETHAWCHGGGQNPVVRFLQDMCLVITPTHHAKHHHSPYNKRFCTLTNWVNPILDRAKFWQGLEWLIGCFGIHTNRLSPDRQGV